MRTLYLDCISGIAGDMTLAALVDLGADSDYIYKQLAALSIDPFQMEFVTVDRRGITAKWLKLSFDQTEHHDGHYHEHQHDHGHEHEHGHQHDHGHEHEHHHEHQHDHGHQHEHEHNHDHIHIHDDHQHHNHSHSHDHEHQTGHHHDHDNGNHGHNHTHEHAQGHSHEHEHTHDHVHEHSHEHTHDHAHGHDHGHTHSHSHDHRKASDIIQMIENSSLPTRVKERSLSIFHLIAVAEGKIHGMDPADVHFHEVGAMDSILDIIGVCLALENLNIGKIIFSPIPTGTGRLRMAHGLYPIPAPATAELLRGVPLSSFTAMGELTTPTGAGIVKALAADFGQMPAGTIDRIGYGAGTKNFDHPNVVRAVLYEMEHTKNIEETIVVLEAQVDDSTGEALGFAMEQLFAAGALDVYYTPIYMKKNRPGVLLSVLCHPADRHRCEDTLLTETSTFGVRRSEWQRKALERQWIHVNTIYGSLRVKQAIHDERILHQSPEYEDAANAARAYNVPLEAIYREVYKQLN